MCVYNFEFYKCIANFYEIFQSHTQNIKNETWISHKYQETIKSLRNLNMPQTFLTKTSFLLSSPCQLMGMSYFILLPQPICLQISSTLSSKCISNSTTSSSAAALVHATICPPHDGFYSLPTDVPAPQSSQNEPPLYLGFSLWHSFFPNPSTNPPLISTE